MTPHREPGVRPILAPASGVLATLTAADTGADDDPSSRCQSSHSSSRSLRLDERGADPGVPAAMEGIGVGSAGRGSPLGTDGETFAASAEPSRLRQANRPAARNRVLLGRSLPERRDRRPLRRVAEVHVDAGDQIARVIDVVPVRQVLEAAHAGSALRPGSLWSHVYHPRVARPMNPLLASPRVGLSRRCASTPSSKFTFPRSSTPRP